MRSLFQLATALLLATTLSALAQDSAPLDDATVAPPEAAGDIEVTDSDADLAQAADVLADASGPIAFGVVYFNGAKQSGTSNWSSTYNSTYKRYEISISGENYYYTKYSTVITPAGDKRFCRSSSVGGKLLVYCYDSNGAAQTSRFGFLTFKP